MADTLLAQKIVLRSRGRLRSTKILLISCIVKLFRRHNTSEDEIQGQSASDTSYIRDIFSEVVDQDFLSKDPASKIKVPARLRETDTTTLSWEQLRLALSKLHLRDRIILELDMTNALRPGELFALRWKCFNHAESTMRLIETVYKGQIRPWGKTKKVWASCTFRKSCLTTSGS